MAVMAGHGHRAGNHAAMPANQLPLTGPFKLKVTGVPWWLGWEQVEELMTKPLTVPQPGGHPPVVLPPVPGFLGGFCSTMEVDNQLVRERDVVIVMRLKDLEGARAAALKLQHYAFYSKSGLGPWSATVMQILRRRAVPVIPDDPLNPRFKRRLSLAEQAAADEAAQAEALPPPPPLPPTVQPAASRAAAGFETSTRSQRKAKARAKAKAEKEAAARGAAAKAEAAAGAAGDSGSVAPVAAGAEQQETLPLPPPPPAPEQGRAPEASAEPQTAKQPSVVSMRQQSPPSALPNGDAHSALPSDLAPKQSGGASQPSPPPPPLVQPADDAGPPPVPPPPPSGVPFDLATAAESPPLPPPREPPIDTAATELPPPLPPPPPSGPAADSSAPPLPSSELSDAAQPPPLPVPETSAQSAPPLPPSESEGTVELQPAAGSAAEATAAADTPMDGLTPAEDFDKGERSPSRQGQGAAAHTRKRSAPDMAAAAHDQKQRQPRHVASAPGSRATSGPSRDNGASCQLQQKRLRDGAAPAEQPPKRRRSPPTNGHLLPTEALNPGLAVPADAMPTDPRRSLRASSGSFNGPPLPPLPPPPSRLAAPATRQQQQTAGNVTGLSTPRSAELTPRGGTTRGGGSNSNGSFGAAAIGPGPRKLRMGDAACLVECTHLAGPNPDEVALPTAALEVGELRPAAAVAADLDALNVQRDRAVQLLLSPTRAARDAADFAALARQLGPDQIARGTARSNGDATWRWWIAPAGQAAQQLLGPTYIGSRPPSVLVGMALPCWQGKLMEDERLLGNVRLLGPGPEVHTLPAVLQAANKFPLKQLPAEELRGLVAGSTAVQLVGSREEAASFSAFVAGLLERRQEGLVVQLDPPRSAGFRKLWLLPSTSGPHNAGGHPRLYTFWRR